MGVMASPFPRAARRVSCLACALAVLVAPALAAAAGVNPEKASAAEKAQAQARYQQGVKEYKTGDFANAVRDFKASYEIVASPNSHMMYARALRKSGKLDEAYEEFALTQNEAGKLAIKLPRYATAAESAEAEKNAVLQKVAAISVEIDGDPSQVTLYVGKREVPHARWRAIAVKPGQVDVTARVTGGRRAWRTVTAQVGHVTRVKLDTTRDVERNTGPLPPPAASTPTRSASNEARPADHRPVTKHRLRPYAYAAGGIGVAGLATFAISGAMSHSTYNHLEQTCKDRVCSPAQTSDIDRGRTEQTVANVGLAFGIAGAGAAVALFVIDLQHSSPDKDAASQLHMAAGPGSVSVRGTF